MIRWVIYFMLMAAVTSCTTHRPTMREPIVAEFQRSDRSAVMEALTNILESQKIPVSRSDLQKGAIVSDSFEVLPEDCDCGMNFFGAQYPGTRRGKMRILVSGIAETRIKFEFAALLTITANNRQVNCTSFGLLEERILVELEQRLGTVRVNAQN